MAEAHWDGQLGCFMLPIKALVLILAQQMPLAVVARMVALHYRAPREGVDDA
jgi:hypothetical protein